MTTDALGAAALRLYVFVVLSATLLLAPIALQRIRVERVDTAGVVSGRRLADGSVSGQGAVIRAFRIGDGPWIQPASFEARRLLRNISVGTPLTYRLASPERQAEGMLRDAPRSRARVIVLLVMTAIALSCCLSALALALAGSDPASLLAAATLAGLGGIFADQFIRPAGFAFAGNMANVLAVFWLLLPRGVAGALLAVFLTRFPTPRSAGGITRAMIAVSMAGGILWALIDGLGQVPGLLDGLPIRAQVGLLSLMQPQILQLVTFLAASVATLIMALRQWKALRAAAGRDSERAHRGIVAALLVLLGIGPTMLAVGIQSASILLLGRQTIPIVAMAVSFLPMVLIPIGIAYAVLGRRVESFGLLVRRALLFTFAARTVRVICMLPAVVVAFLLFQHRDQSLSALFSDFPVAAPLALLAVFVGLRYGDRAQRLLERVFFRERVAAREILQSLAEKTRGVTDASALAALVCGEVDRAFHLESVSLLLADARAENYATRDGQTSLPAFSELVTRVTRTESALDVLREGAWPPQEGEWLAREQVRLLVPLRSGDGGLLGILALGERRSELPFDADDLEMLHLVATAAGLAVENQILRSSPSGARFPVGEPDSPDDARYCAACRAVFPAEARLCAYDGTALTSADVPTVLSGKYRAEERLGAGGMGVVYRARDVTLGRSVALKTMPALSTREASRLLREARALASLPHQHLAVIFSVESWRGRPVLVVEYLPGGTLEQRVRERRLEVGEVLSFAGGIAGALAAAHEAGMLHRDVKPSNIGFDHRGTPKLFDFGLARYTTELARRASSQPGEQDQSSGLGGTPSYLAPEIILGAPASPASDVWALGVTIYECLTGVHPFREATHTATLNRILVHEVREASTLRADCPPALASLLPRMLARDPEQRPTARDVQHALVPGHPTHGSSRPELPGLAGN